MEASASSPVRGWLFAGLLGLVVAGGVGWLAYGGEREISAAGSVPDSGAPVAAKLDYTLKDLEGRDVRLADFKGRPLVLNFWATYCGPCKTEIPIFVELVEKYREQKLAILGISVDDSLEDLRPFAAQYKMNYPVLVGLGHDEMMEAYEAVMFIPVTWFVRPDGTVALKHPGSASKAWFEQQIRALLPAAPEAQ